MTKDDRPKTVGEILGHLKKTSPLGKQLDQAKIWQRWPELAGEPLWMHGRPLGFRENTLYVEADSAVWMHKFAYRKWDIIGRVNRMAGHELISELFIVLKDEDSDLPSQHDV